MNVLSDIVLGDAWGVDENKEGSSVILARTARGHKIIEEARRAGIIQVDSIDPEAVFKGQHIETKRRDWTAFTKAWRRAGYQPPEFGISSRQQTLLEVKLENKYHRTICQSLKLVQAASYKKLIRKAHIKYFLYRIRNKISRLIKAIV